MNTSNAGSSGPLHVVSARLPTGDTPVAGVPLVPYVLVRRGVAGDSVSSLSAALSAPVSGDDAPDEETALATGSSRFALRFRWYRSVLLGGAGRGGMPAVCWAHPDREAAIQCVICLRCRGGDGRTSYHCSAECLRAHWPFHKELHEAKAARAANDGYDSQKGAMSASTALSVGGGLGSILGGGGAGSTSGIANNQQQREREQRERDQQLQLHVSGGSGETWVEVGSGREYVPGPDDVGASLRVEVVGVDVASQEATGRALAVSTARVRPAPRPPRRARVPLPLPPAIAAQQLLPTRPQFSISSSSSSSSSSPSSPSSRFTVLTYNLLADLYATPEQFGYTPPWALGWGYRRQNLLRELLAADADVLCLQEVQSNHFADFLAPELAAAGYAGVYKKKTAEVFTGSSYATDGCATFFRRARFGLVKKYEVEFNKAALSLADGALPPERRQGALNRLLKDNVALIAVLEAVDGGGGGGAGGRTEDGGGASGNGGGGASVDGSSSSSSPPNPPPPPSRRRLVCVANTHIHANPELSDVKLWQVHTLLKGLEKISASADIPMVVAGDFNSAPGSAAHALLVRGRVPASHPDLANDPLGILRPPSKLAHGLPLASAYAAAATLPHSAAAAAALAAGEEPVVPGAGPSVANGGGGGGPFSPSSSSSHHPSPSHSSSASAAAATAANNGISGGAADHARNAALVAQRLRDAVDVDGSGEPRFTNAGRDFRGTLDYILYSADALAPTALLELPTEADLCGGGDRAGRRAGVVGVGLPSERWSSDHVALLAEFAYLPR